MKASNEIIETVVNEDVGIAAEITAGPRGFYVTLRDTDALESVLTIICPTIQMARAKAARMIG